MRQQEITQIYWVKRGSMNTRFQQNRQMKSLLSIEETTKHWVFELLLSSKIIHPEPRSVSNSIAPISPIHLEDTQAVPLADEMASKILCIFALVSTYPSPFFFEWTSIPFTCTSNHPVALRVPVPSWNGKNNGPQHFKKYYNTGSKVPQFQQSNLIMPLACSKILWIHTDNAMKPLRYMSISFQWVCRN